MNKMFTKYKKKVNKKNHIKQAFKKMKNNNKSKKMRMNKKKIIN